MSVIAELKSIMTMDTTQYQSEAKKAESITKRLQDETLGGARAMRSMDAALSGSASGAARIAAQFGTIGAFAGKAALAIGVFTTAYQQSMKWRAWIDKNVFGMESPEDIAKDTEAMEKKQSLTEAYNARKAAHKKRRDDDARREDKDAQEEQLKADEKMMQSYDAVLKYKDDQEKAALDKEKKAEQAVIDNKAAVRERYYKDKNMSGLKDDLTEAERDKAKFHAYMPASQTDSLARIGGLVGAAVNPQMRSQMAEEIRARGIAEIDKNIAAIKTMIQEADWDG